MCQPLVCERAVLEGVPEVGACPDHKNAAGGGGIELGSARLSCLVSMRSVWQEQSGGPWSRSRFLVSCKDMP